jgi:hypothetical protein
MAQPRRTDLSTDQFRALVRASHPEVPKGFTRRVHVSAVAPSQRGLIVYWGLSGVYWDFRQDTQPVSSTEARPSFARWRSRRELTIDASDLSAIGENAATLKEFAVDGTEAYKECPSCNATRRIRCSTCQGTGEVMVRVPCDACGGSGKRTSGSCRACAGTGGFDRRSSCSQCDGSGEVKCGECDGKGYFCTFTVAMLKFEPIEDVAACDPGALWFPARPPKMTPVYEYIGGSDERSDGEVSDASKGAVEQARAAVLRVFHDRAAMAVADYARLLGERDPAFEGGHLVRVRLKVWEVSERPITWVCYPRLWSLTSRLPRALRPRRPPKYGEVLVITSPSGDSTQPDQLVWKRRKPEKSRFLRRLLFVEQPGNSDVVLSRIREDT